MKSRFKDIFYSMGSLSSGIIQEVFNMFYYFFYVDILKFDSTAIAIAVTVYTLWNGINDPLFGYISDRTRTRWGRRIPYIMFFTIPMALAFMMVWMPPMAILQTDFSKIAYFFISICLYDTFFTIVVLNWTALFPEMYMEEKDRNRVSGLRQILGVVGVIIATVAAQPFYEKYGWPAMGIVFGIIGGITMYMSLLGVKENPSRGERQSMNIIASFKKTLVNYSFLMFVLANTCVEVIKGVVIASIPFFMKYVIGSEESQPLLMGVLFIAAIAFMPIWVRVTNKVGARKAFVYSLSALGAALLLFFVVNSVAATLVAAVITGFGLGGMLMLPDVLVSQVIDEDKLKTGERREGAYFGVNAFVIRFSVAIQVNIMALVQRWTGYDSHLSTQPSSALVGTRFLMSIVPIIFVIGAVVFGILYPLHGEKLRKVKENIIEV